MTSSQTDAKKLAAELLEDLLEMLATCNEQGCGHAEIHDRTIATLKANAAALTDLSERLDLDGVAVLDELEQRAEAAETELAELKAGGTSLIRRNFDELRARLAAVEKYTIHQLECAVWGRKGEPTTPESVCTCGLAAALVGETASPEAAAEQNDGVRTGVRRDGRGGPAGEQGD